ncbi:MAG: T9SS type A sorting domain-containing protein [bacterium]
MKISDLKISGLVILLFMIGTQINSIYAQYGKDNNGERGLTVNQLSTDNIKIIGVAPKYEIKSVLRNNYQSDILLQDWSLIDQVDFDMYLEAGSHYSVYFDEAAIRLHKIEPQLKQPLTTNAQAAINKAPKWIRKQLTWVFSNITDVKQDLWASAILDAVDPYVDEVAFTVAHSSPQYLSSSYGSPALFLENARLIYETDESFNYVKVVDYGSSTNYDDYYSSTRYYSTRENVKYEFRVPTSVYYWYIVFPKISDEIPAYINPATLESNSTHKNNIAAPPDGKFWRDYLLNYNDAGYSKLKDQLAGCSIVWDGLSSLNAGKESAIVTLTNWINSVMSFTSGNERPHQPVRIYKKHIGRCGEYSDIVAAACRAALIPCTSILSTACDHTWNEFWDEGWNQWEPVNNCINKPLDYEDGWGKKFGTVFEIRGDGYLTSVIDTYQNEAPSLLNIYVTDKNGEPVDGAKVRIASRESGTSDSYWDFCTVTDNEGKCSILIGDNRDYFARVDSEIGNNPQSTSQLLEVASLVIPGQTYNVSFPLTGEMPSINSNSIDVPTTGDAHYKMVINFTSPEQLLIGDSWLEDIANNSKYCYSAPYGWIDFMMTDEANYNNYFGGSSFDAFNIYNNSNDAQVEFNVPSDGNWYCLFTNYCSSNNAQYLTGTVELYSDETVSNNSDNLEELPGKFELSQNYPNPFNPSTTIKYSIPASVETPYMASLQHVTLKVYDLLGSEVATLVNEQKQAGNYSVEFNAKGLTSGVYFYKLQTGNGISITKKLVVMK